MYTQIFVSILILLSTSDNFVTSVDYDGWLNIKLYHALDPKNPEVFTERGNVSIQSIRTGSSVIEQNTLTDKDRELFKELIDEKRMYRVKSVVKSYDGSTTDFLTSVKACAIASVQLTDSLVVSLDHAGTVLAVSLIVWGRPEGCDVVNLEDLDEFNTEIFVRHMEIAPVPDTASYIQKIEQEKEARERGEVKDNRSFLAKYWMYIVPVAIFVLVSGAANPEAGAAR